MEFVPNASLSKGPFTCMITMPNMAKSLSISILEFRVVAINYPKNFFI